MIEHPFGIYLKVVLLGLGRLFPNFLRNRHTNIQSGYPIHLEVSILYVLNISILERVVWLDFFSPMTVVMFHGFIYAGIQETPNSVVGLYTMLAAICSFPNCLPGISHTFTLKS